MSPPDPTTSSASAERIGLEGAEVLLIANPTSGRGQGSRALPEVETVLRAAGAQVRVHRTQGPGEAKERASRAAQDGTSLVVAVGGDGTLHEVLNGLCSARTPPDAALPALGLVPSGTGNDYARMLGVPSRDPAGAAALLAKGQLRRVDLGRIEGCSPTPEWFCNNVGLAFMAAANAAHTESRLPAALSYSLGGFLSYVSYQPEPFQVEAEGRTWEGELMVGQIGIGRFCGGGVDLTPDAGLDHGRFQVVLIPKRGKLRGFVQWPSIARGEKIPGTQVLTGTRIRLKGRPGFLIHADGEVRRATVGELTLTLVPAALRVIAKVNED